MQTNAVYVFKTPFYTPCYKEFYRPEDLKNFLQKFNFLRSHQQTNIPTGLPEFQLGCRMGVIIDGYYYKSEVKWGPKFIVGHHVRIDKNGKIFASVPMDKILDDGENKNRVSREYQEIRFSKNMANAIIDLRSLRQIWPQCKTPSTELAKFFKKIIREQETIRKR